MKPFKLAVTLLFFCFFSQTIIADNSKTIEIEDLSHIFNHGVVQKRVIVLYVYSPFCRFCKKLEKEIIQPMIKSGSYNKKIELRKLNLVSKNNVLDFKGRPYQAKKIMKRYNVSITPTLLFLDAQGNQLSEPIIGYSNDDFFWYYFDLAIKNSNDILSKKFKAP